MYYNILLDCYLDAAIKEIFCEYSLYGINLCICYTFLL